MTFRLAVSRHFERRLKRFRRKNPQLNDQVDQVLRDLEEDPYQAHLRLHALQGKFQGYHAVRIDYSNRIVIILMAEERVIRLIGIGTHDEVYR